VTQDAGHGNLIAAIGEAAFMTGMERNGDEVVMCSYAPLFVQPEWRHWNPNAIVFDAAHCFGTPSYHCQALFMNNRADTVLPLEAESSSGQFHAAGGMIGVGTWLTQAEYKDIKVTHEGKTLFESDFSKDSTGWKVRNGKWAVKDGALQQTGGDENSCAFAGDKKWTEYTYSLKARKLGGAEGFLVIFQSDGHGGKSWWNIGGWGNSRHAIEAPGVTDEGVPGKIETGKWYDIRIEIAGGRVRCYLDDKLVHDVTRATDKALYAMAGRKNDTGEVIVKIVNTSNEPQDTAIVLRGANKIESTGRAIVLTGEGPDAENSFEAPNNVISKEEKIDNASARFNRTLPPNSITILRLKAGS
jgi:alpha-L-arabinofuranosidase